MGGHEDRFGRLREVLATIPLDFCLVYRPVPSITGRRLRWCKGVSRRGLTHEEYAALADALARAALLCYRCRRNAVLSELVPRPGAGGRRWYALGRAARHRWDAPPANCLGQRWWCLVIGSGAVREAGYVVAARVAAREALEVRAYIPKVQGVFKKSRVSVQATETN